MVTTMVATLAHRGPDDEGVADDDGWAVGMRRLAVQDVTGAGHQPMSLGPLTLVFNGEVYNFVDLRAELGARGHSFHSGSDTEVVLHALAEWGTAALARFNGMFALALIDSEQRTALLARDRFGKKPLFVASLHEGLAFASELKAILAIAGGQLRIDHAALAEYFRLQYVPAPACIFEQARKLPPASWTKIDLDSGTQSAPQTFWWLPEPTRDPATPDELLETVCRAVDRRLIADVPVGAFLSGGNDSSLVVACMRQSSSDVRTFSIGFTDPRYDESVYAQAVARHLETEHTHLTLSPGEALGIAPDLSAAYDEPFADSSAIPTIAVARLARQDVTVALSGDGGDELFGGYQRYRIGPALRLAGSLPKGVPTGLLEKLPSRSRLGKGARLLSSLAQAGSRARAYEEMMSIWRSSDLRRLMPDAPASGTFEQLHWAQRHSIVENMMRCDLRTYLIDDIMQKVDRASMSVSLEARNPLLDPDVVAVALRSMSVAERSPGQKPLLRAALR
ncbi:MAG: asparagine synthase (glutamine-hydrolyzing), partial [Solirubrobacteraceae bacterium]